MLSIIGLDSGNSNNLAEQSGIETELQNATKDRAAPYRVKKKERKRNFRFRGVPVNRKRTRAAAVVEEREKEERYLQPLPFKQKGGRPIPSENRGGICC